MTRTRPRLSSPRRIAVIGAGIAGLAAARTLQRSGHDVQVFEAAPVPETFLTAALELMGG